MLPILAMLIAAKAFRDYDTIEELLDIVLPEEEMLYLQWKESVLSTPFFKSMSAREKIEKANAFSFRLRALGFRTGYPRPPTIHDFRAEGLYWIGMYAVIPSILRLFTNRFLAKTSCIQPLKE